MEQLKNVWTVADNPPTNNLDRQKFAVALRLIQLLQNGQKGQGSNLAAPPGVVLRPVYLEGISGAQVPMPQQQQQQQAQSPPQQQQSPPQQQQQRPPQQYQQPPPQQQQAGRPPMGAPQNSSTALTTQDPYALTPNEQSRYDAIFPQYAKEDGFVHGKEAVELFSKSGLNHTQLRDIWNMVDHPVDNKLDKIEFAIAMHLIVCISKKNLPFPKMLPMSLKGLKQQQAPQAPSSPRMQPQGQSAGGIPPPSPSQQMQPGMMSQQQQMPPQSPTGGQPQRVSMPSTAGPPPLPVAPGGMDISDAFEGLSTSGSAGAGGLGAPSTSGFGNEPSKEPSYGMGGGASSAQEQKQLSPLAAPAQATHSPPRMEQSHQPPAVSMSPPPQSVKTSEDLAQSYNMQDATGELNKLKTVLQKLQAENISLKAQLGSMSEEEKDMQKQVHAVVTEIGELSNQLTTLRAEVLASKSRLLAATAELKAAQEKKG